MNKDYIEIIESNTPVIEKEDSDIYLVDFTEVDPLLQYIGELRYKIYQSTGAGYSGTNTDLDDFDVNATHILIWDKVNKEVIGGYRIFKSKDLLKDGIPQTYLSENFNFQEGFQDNLDQIAEVGRSFIQEKYWNGNYLDHLWMGIGRYILQNPNVRYLLGSVSMGTMYSEQAVAHIIYLFRKWFWIKNNIASAKIDYIFPDKFTSECETLYNEDAPEKDMRKLKVKLKELNLTIPVLMRRYVSLTEQGGTNFLSFAEDPGYDSVVSLCWVDITKLKEMYRNRYLG